MEQFTDSSSNLRLRKRTLNGKSDEDSPDEDGRCLGFVEKRSLKKQVDCKANEEIRCSQTSSSALFGHLEQDILESAPSCQRWMTNQPGRSFFLVFEATLFGSIEGKLD